MGLSSLRNLSSSRYTIIVSASCVIFAIIVSTIPLAKQKAEVVFAKNKVTARTDNSAATSIPIFKESSSLFGINHRHFQRAESIDGLDDSLAGGACAFDYDNDGWIDLFFIGGSGSTRHYGKKSWWEESHGNLLYHNHSGRYFSDVTSDTGLAINTAQQPQMRGMGCATADFDNDGFVDLLVTTFEGNHLYKNNANGTFTDITQQSGITGNYWSTSAAIADVNGDGLVDFYITNYLNYKKGARTFEKHVGFKDTVPTPFRPEYYDALPNQLYINQGNFTFKEAAAEWGVDDKNGRGLSALWIAANEDRFPDLLVLNDTGSPNRLYINNGSNALTPALDDSSLLKADGSRAAAVGDINNDGLQDLLITRGAGKASLLLINTGQIAKGSNHFTYQEQAWNWKVNQTSTLSFARWGSVVADFNNDGANDLYIAQGLATPHMDSPTLPQSQTNALLMQAANHSFLSLPTLESASSRSVIADDFNNDGLLDLVVTNNNGVPHLLLNETPKSQHWLGLKLKSNHSWLGAVIQVKSKDKTFSLHAIARTGFLSQPSSNLHLGLGDNKTIQEVVVTTPDNRSHRFNDISIDAYSEFDLDSNKAVALNYTLGQDVINSSQFLTLTTAQKKSLIDILVSPEVTQDELQLLATFITPQDNEINSFLANTIALTPSESLSPLLYLLLETHDSAVIQTTIRVLEKMELEESVTHLLPLFNQQDEEILCQLAKTFEFWFHEEEAVIEHKYLSIAPLTKLTNHRSERVVQCVASTLAEAENIRGAYALLPQLNRHAIETQIAVTRALGLIRQAEVEPNLLMQLHTNQNGRVLAQTFIALKRLALKDIDFMLSEFVATAPTLLSIEAHYQLKADFFVELLNSKEGIVFERKEIDRLATLFLEGFSLNSVDKNSESLVPLLELYRLLQRPLNQDLLSTFTSSTNPDIRLAAYQLAAKQNSQAIALQFLKDQDANLIDQVSHFLLDQHVQLDGAILTPYLLASSSQMTAIKLLPLLTTEWQTVELTQILAPESELDGSAISLLNELCRSNQIPALRLPERHFKEAKNTLPAVIQCGLANSIEGIAPELAGSFILELLTKADGQFLTTIVESLARSGLTTKQQAALFYALKQIQLSPEKQLGMLMKLAEKDSVIAQAQLSKLLLSLPDPLLQQVLDAYTRHSIAQEKSPKDLNGQILALKDDSKRSLDVRLKAAKLYLEQISINKELNVDRLQLLRNIL